MLFASVPSVLLVRDGRLLRYGGLAVMSGAIICILLGIDSIVGAVVVAIANAILVSAALLAAMKQLTLVEDRLESALSAIHDVEIAEQRRQTFGASHALELGTSSAPGADGSNNGRNRGSRVRRNYM